MNKSLEINTKRTIIAIVLSILVLIAAQLVSLLAGNGAIALGAQEAVGNVVAAILYPLLTLLGLKQLCNSSIVVYFVFIMLAVILLKRKKE